VAASEAWVTVTGVNMLGCSKAVVSKFTGVTLLMLTVDPP